MVPFEAVKEREMDDWNSKGDAGQVALGVICSIGFTVKVQLNGVEDAPLLSVRFTENGKLPATGGVPVKEIPEPVVPLDESHEGPERLHP